MANKTQRPARTIVTLADLAPRREVMGGSQRRVFGAAPDSAADPTVGSGASSRKIKDLAPKTGAVKGGKLSANDALTLVRAAKPTIKKDLPPRQDVKGGKKIAANDNMTLLREAKPTKKIKDLGPKKSAVNGGGHNLNDNLTLVRAAKPIKKDLPPRQDVKGGKKTV